MKLWPCVRSLHIFSTSSTTSVRGAYNIVIIVSKFIIINDGITVPVIYCIIA